jgi:hypothetical protein
MFLENCKLEYDVNDIHTFYKTRGQSQTLKADVLKYFYNNKEFKNDEFWHIFLENIDDDISKDYIMKGYY